VPQVRKHVPQALQNTTEPYRALEDVMEHLVEGHGTLWNIMESSGRLCNYGKQLLWKLMESHGNSSKVMEPSWAFHDILIVNSI